MLPLNGVRIVAVEQYGAGPFGTMMLADLGAEVIKIESRAEGGDVSRGVGPYFVDGADRSTASVFFQGLNRNKRSLTLDLKHPDGRSVFHDLVSKADAVAGNLRGDVPAKLGLTYASLRAVNPKIVCGHLTAYGRTGSRAAWPGYDYLMQAEAGFFSINGEPGTPPARFGLSIVDLMAGVALGLALVSGIVRARATGVGGDVDVSLFDTALATLNYVGNWRLNAGHVPRQEQRSAHPSLTPCQLYRTSDGWIYIMANKEKFWPALCAGLNRADLARDPRFADFALRLKHRAQLTELLDGAFSTRTTAEWMAVLAGRVPAAPILDVAGALASPFVAETDRVHTVTMPDGHVLRLLNCPIRSGEQTPQRPAPNLGGDNDAILDMLGYDAVRIAALRAQRVI
ncbi:MAG: CoA transferase [Alphaproteobacteria bacterium]|nr:CoA transferase [Alphaproteobacteria bacterium]